MGDPELDRDGLVDGVEDPVTLAVAEGEGKEHSTLSPVDTAEFICQPRLSNRLDRTI